MKPVTAASFAASLLLFLPPHGAAAATETVLYSFCSRTNCSDGAQPYSSLLPAKGKLYGAAFEGGDESGCKNGCGTLFALNLKNGAEKTLYTFCSEQGCLDGANSEGGLIEARGDLYGTTAFGGDYGAGTLFAFNGKTRTENVVHSFGDGPDGSEPTANVVAVKGALYGATGSGGSNGFGTVFSFDLKSGAETVVYSFCNAQNCGDGAIPESGLISVSGLLYGTTSGGGSHGHGTVFSLDPATGAETALYSFCALQNCADGNLPEDGLIAVNGMLYGTTAAGGKTSCANGCGTVFAVNPQTGAESVVYSFCSQQKCADGETSSANLLNVNGALYGTTLAGGAFGGGVVFAVNPNSGIETVVHSFGAGADGAEPEYGLTAVGSALYGATVLGGAHGEGAIFSVAP
jgi:uncharacterized repeat protein (TIGR03803 family)